ATLADMAGIQPELWVERAAAAGSFYPAAFGARGLHQGGEGDEIVAQPAGGDAAVWGSPRGAGRPRLKPGGSGRATRRGPRAAGRVLRRGRRRGGVLRRGDGGGARGGRGRGRRAGGARGRFFRPFRPGGENGQPPGPWPPAAGLTQPQRGVAG